MAEKQKNRGYSEIQAILYTIENHDISWFYARGLKDCYMIDYSEEWADIVEHYRKYGCAPDPLTFYPQHESLVDEREKFSESPDYIADSLKEDYVFNLLCSPSSKFGSIASSGQSKQALQYIIPQYIDILNNALPKNDTSLKDNFFIWSSKDTSEKISTGFYELDKVINIRQKGSLTLIQGSTGQGKSWCLIKILAEQLIKGKSVIFYSDEMTKEEITKRLEAIVMRSSMYEAENGDLTYQQRAFDIISEGDAHFICGSDISGDTIDGLYGFIKSFTPDVVIIDGIKYMTDQKSDKKGYEMMEQAAVRLLRISQDCSCAIVSAVQSNRGAEKSKSGKDTVAGSYDMLGIATTVISLNRSNDYFILTVEKSRHTSDGNVFAYKFDWNTCSFYYDPYFSDTDDDIPDPRFKKSKKPECIGKSGKTYTYDDILSGDVSEEVKILKLDGDYTSNFFRGRNAIKQIKTYIRKDD